MPKNISDMSDEEIEKLVDDFFNKTPKKVLMDIFEKSGFFKEFKQEEINWNVFIPLPSTFHSVDNQKVLWDIGSENHFILKENFILKGVAAA